MLTYDNAKHKVQLRLMGLSLVAVLDKLKIEPMMVLDERLRDDLLWLILREHKCVCKLS